MRGMGGVELLVLLAVIAVIVLAVAWVILPFAVFGARERLDRIISELEGIRREIRGKQEAKPEPEPVEELSLDEQHRLFDQYASMSDDELRELLDSDLKPAAKQMVRAELGRR